MSKDEHLWWGLIIIAAAAIVSGMAGCGGGGPIACEDPTVGSIEPRIIDGEPSTDRRSTVHVTGNGYCSGTVIGPYTVLTAAHCENMMNVCLGFYTDCFLVSEDIERDGANKPGAKDLRILHTYDELPGPYAEFGLLEDCNTYIAQGYGFGSEGELHEREVAVCLDNFGILIASEGICNGDSGGPLYCNDKIVGVSSFGYGAPNVCDGSTGFVNLEADNNIDWIEENLL